MNKVYNFFNVRNEIEFTKYILKLFENNSDLLKYYNKYYKTIDEEEYTPLLHDWINSEYKCSVYNDQMYKIDLLACYNHISSYAIDYINKFVKFKQKSKKIKSILDIGAGLGLTTLQLALNNPDIKIYYYDINVQYNISKKIIINKPQNLIFTDYDFIEHSYFDIIVALEFFEHFKEPLKNVYSLPQYKTLMYTAPFYDMGIGHFEEYKLGKYNFLSHDFDEIFLIELLKYHNLLGKSYEDEVIILEKINE